METELSKMTLQELWELFPIFLTEHKQVWHKWYEQEVCNLQEHLPMGDIVRISHIGSTAIKAIWAKPIIDILVEAKFVCDLQQISSKIQDAGYLEMSSNEKRISFNKGYTAAGFEEKVFHLHLAYVGDHDELYFRDYLNANSEIAREYEKLKLDLWPRYEHNRDAYTTSKTDFVKQHTAAARNLLGSRYEDKNRDR